ncbi:MAG: tRNA epoxyqueuosine(34) reductase QueG [Bacteroidales bacterium]
MTGENSKYSKLIKGKARDLGFSGCGISVACRLDNEAARLEKWLQQGMHGTMKYMENHFEERVDPRKLVDGARSVISVLHNYFPADVQKDPDAPVLSKYAYGTDYHFVVKDKLRQLLQFMNRAIGKVNGRAFVDSAPVLDRVWAARSGLGWIGKNTNLLVKGRGSFFFIGELIVDIQLSPDLPDKDHCGNCRLCMDACPTGAIIAPRKLDARRCISYMTIEYRESLPSEIKDKMHNRVFGCDICQDVCPWNRKASPHKEPLLSPVPGLTELKAREWYNIDKECFDHYFRKTAVNRAGFKQIKRNLEFLKL